MAQDRLNWHAALIAGAADDAAVRARLAASGALFGGYHPEMEAVHSANALLLRDGLTPHGWPREARAAEAAWTIAQHAIGLPDFQRACLRALQAAPAPPWQAAMLEDRIAVFEGRPQRYGTQFDWDDAGQLSPCTIDDPDGVDARRAAVGLEPLERATLGHRERGEPPPPDLAAFRAGQRAWRRRTGWLAPGAANG